MKMTSRSSWASRSAAEKKSGFTVNSPAPSSVNVLEIRQVAAAARGDRDARRALFERHRETVYRAALRITGRHEDALDVLQDSFIRAFERLDTFQGGSAFRTWLLRIVANRALDLTRAKKVRMAAPLLGEEGEEWRPIAAGQQAPPGQRLEQVELGDRLQQAIDALPADQKAVFSLHAAGELTYGEIAEILGVPAGTVMSRLYHARQRLHQALADLAPDRGWTKP